MYTILVVDDENETRNAICNYFPWEEIGFAIIGQAENGQQALDFLKSKDADVLLCDIKMPVMDGLDVAKELHARKPNKVKIIFLSGYRDFEYAQKALLYGVKNYIVKPLKYKEIVEVFTVIREELDFEHSSMPVEAARNIGLNESCIGIGSFGEKVITIVREYVNSEYRDASLENAAKRVHMNPNYLSQFFKQKTGECFSDYVIKVKMQKAAELLKDIHYKAYEISEIVGYSNTKNFTRTFKNFFGISPREYKYGIGKK